MVTPRKKRFPLPKRFNAALSDAAYTRLRTLNDEYGLSNNYLLVVLLERLHDFADPVALDAAFRTFIAEHGTPASKTGLPMQSNT